MTPAERDAAQRLRAWIDSDSADCPDSSDLRTVLDALDRQQRLASEELTEEERNYVAKTVEYEKNDPNFRCYAGNFLPLFAKLQAQLADALTFRNLFIGNGWGDNDRLATVEYETAMECLRLISADQSPFVVSKTLFAEVIRRRFNLAAPQAAETRLCEGCYGREEHWGAGHANYRRSECPVCRGTGRVTAAERRDRHIEERTP